MVLIAMCIQYEISADKRLRYFLSACSPEALLKAGICPGQACQVWCNLTALQADILIADTAVSNVSGGMATQIYWCWNDYLKKKGWLQRACMLQPQVTSLRFEGARQASRRHAHP